MSKIQYVKDTKGVREKKIIWYLQKNYGKAIKKQQMGRN